MYAQIYVIFGIQKSVKYRFMYISGMADSELFGIVPSLLRETPEMVGTYLVTNWPSLRPMLPGKCDLQQKKKKCH